MKRFQTVLMYYGTTKYIYKDISNNSLSYLNQEVGCSYLDIDSGLTFDQYALLPNRDNVMETEYIKLAYSDIIVILSS